MSETRREFLKASAVAGGALAANLDLLNGVHAGGSDIVRVGLVGCGGRGSGAIEQCIRGGRNVKVVALADAFRDKAEALRNSLRNLAANNERLRNSVELPDERIFVGLDAYRRVIENVDVVCLATPPGFRPTHIRAAVAARKHIFTEKPVCVDGPGARMCLAAFEEANRHRLSIVAGTQRRYQTGYLASMQKIHDGDLGQITSMRVYWNGNTLWSRRRTDDMTDLQWQLRNWYYFTWLCGDHIVEQHVHNLDVANWALQNSHPTRCVGLGGRQVRVEPLYGHIYDHFAVDYEYPNGVRVMSMCRQMPRPCENNISEAVTGTRGTWTSSNYRIVGERPWQFPAREDNNPYQDEHVALINSIRTGRPINDLKNVTESSLTAIMGRMACYTGRAVTWDQALNSQQNLMPERLAWDMELPVPPVAMPGTTPLT
ncbi:MAG: Gfo/Idh/MocA family oxidoreductase [Gemmataceae bacterium]|nr:Gfo/Idh/MocA family oxidoreductase [Gemmataceae bacterium]